MALLVPDRRRIVFTCRCCAGAIHSCELYRRHLEQGLDGGDEGNAHWLEPFSYRPAMSHVCPLTTRRCVWMLAGQKRLRGVRLAPEADTPQRKQIGGGSQLDK